MAYEFIATGLKPAQPVKSMLDSYMQGKEFQQNQEINKVNIEAGKTRNEAADIALKSAKKQVAAEEQWAKLPRDENGSLDPQAERQFQVEYPEYYDIRKKAEVEGIRGQLGITADKLKMSAALFSNAKSPEDITKAQAFAKENFGLDLKYDEAVFGAANKYSSELARTIELINNDMATAAADGDWETVTRLQEVREAEGKLAQLEVLKVQSEIEKNRAAKAVSQAREKALQSFGGATSKAPSGYRWKEDGSQEPIPGGPVDIKNKKTAVVESKALESTNSIIDAEIRNIDKLIGSEDGKVKPHPGLNSMLGSVDARIPSVLTDTRNAEALLESLQSKASIAALRDIRSGGSQSIGQITEREWPRLENMKATLQMYQDEKQFTKNLKEYRDELMRMKGHAQSAYEDFVNNPNESNGSNDLSKISTEDLLNMLNLSKD